MKNKETPPPPPTHGSAGWGGGGGGKSVSLDHGPIPKPARLSECSLTPRSVLKLAIQTASSLLLHPELRCPTSVRLLP
ncbi:hypothetical protein BaRGS_00017190 [Batillaria attramentaria]|uniref:Uncharacterized protein n=1 Tax=Batillaria attramentaria TaxID=370345 RepID=A0ABD0KWX0_9CAEN